jgi:hypothetical protein
MSQMLSFAPQNMVISQSGIQVYAQYIPGLESVWGGAEKVMKWLSGSYIIDNTLNL